MTEKRTINGRRVGWTLRWVPISHKVPLNHKTEFRVFGIEVSEAVWQFFRRHGADIPRYKGPPHSDEFAEQLAILSDFFRRRF